MTKSKNHTKSNGIPWVHLLVGLFGLPFAIIGIASTASLFLSSFNELRMQYWTETPCTIISAVLKDEPGDDLRIVRVVAFYRYQINDKEYLGKRVTPGELASSDIAFYEGFSRCCLDTRCGASHFVALSI